MDQIPCRSKRWLVFLHACILKSVCVCVCLPPFSLFLSFQKSRPLKLTLKTLLPWCEGNTCLVPQITDIECTVHTLLFVLFCFCTDFLDETVAVMMKLKERKEKKKI